LPTGAAVIAGLLTAFSPQLGFYSLALRPDNLVPLPILLSLYFLARATKGRPSHNLVTAGACIGLACWLRSDTLLYAPFLAVFVIPALFDSGKRLRCALILLSAAVLTIIPITIRNVVVFHHFIPLSLGAGVTFVQGIAEYDSTGRFGLPSTDFQTLQLESKLYNRPDYSNDLFSPDGIEREASRLNQGLSVVRSQPLWFASVIVRRIIFMLRYERVSLISARPPVTHCELQPGTPPTWSTSLTRATRGDNGQPVMTQKAAAGPQESLRMTGGDSEPAQVVIFPEANIQKDTDYLLQVPIRIERGSATLHVESLTTGEKLASTSTLVSLADIDDIEQPLAVVKLPFVSRKTNRIQIRLHIGGREHPRILNVGELQLFDLGPAEMGWTYYLRTIVRSLQRFFLTAWMLPFLIGGLCLLFVAGQKKSLVMLSAIPGYYLSSHALFSH
jgi:hypothetical protein